MRLFKSCDLKGGCWISLKIFGGQFRQMNAWFNAVDRIAESGEQDGGFTSTASYFQDFATFGQIDQRDEVVN